MRRRQLMMVPVCASLALSAVAALTKHDPSGTPVSSQLRGQVGEALARLVAGDEAVGSKVAEIVA